MTFMPNAAQPLRDEHADPAEADDADGLLVELDAGVLASASTRRSCSAALAGGDVAGGGEQQRRRRARRR